MFSSGLWFASPQHYRSRANEKAEPQPAPAESPAESEAVSGIRIRKTLGRTTGEEQMSEELRKAAEDIRLEALDYHGHAHEYLIKAVSVLTEAAENHDRLTRERDEARLRLEFADKHVADLDKYIAVAEARGYERGVKEAAEVYETGKSEDIEWIFFIGVRDAILTLLEKPTETKQP
jgi:hypothetical protein